MNCWSLKEETEDLEAQDFNKLKKKQIMSTISITNRNNSYKDIIKDLGFKQQQVFNCLKDSGSLSSEDIKETLKLKDKCSVTGRLKELEERCLITAIGSRDGKTIYTINSEEMAVVSRSDSKRNYEETLIELEKDIKKELSPVTLEMIANKISRLKKLITIVS